MYMATKHERCWEQMQHFKGLGIKTRGCGSVGQHKYGEPPASALCRGYVLSEFGRACSFCALQKYFVAPSPHCSILPPILYSYLPYMCLATRQLPASSSIADGLSSCRRKTRNIDQLLTGGHVDWVQYGGTCNVPEGLTICFDS